MSPLYLTGQSLASRYKGLHSRPDPLDLIIEVAAVIPSKWYEVGIQLGIPHEDIMSFRQMNPTASSVQMFSFIFATWKNHGTSSYTWSTIISALETPCVSHKRLAHELTEKLLTPLGILSECFATVFIDDCLLFLSILFAH